MSMLQQQFEKNQGQKSPRWLQQLRQDSFALYQTVGLPSLRDETWKYTNIKPLQKKEFSLAAPDFDFAPVHADDGFDAIRVFVINGYFHPMTEAATPGLTVKSLAMAIIEKAPEIKRLNTLANTLPHGFAKLNSAFINDGLFLQVADDVVIEKPIHVYYVNTRPESIQYLRNLLVIGAGAKATVIEHYGPGTSSHYCSNSISEIFLERNSHLTHIKIQNEAEDAYHIATTKVQQQADSSFKSYVISLGGKLSRSDTEIDMVAQGCHADQTGLYLGKDRQHFDHHTLVQHRTPHCSSNQLYKGILDDAARAVFNGKVHVFENAVKTDSAQMNKNLLLSDRAEVDSKPELEIYNDDVKCSHGATTGQLDENQFFYLLTRGLDRTTAKSLLMYAFSYEIIASIENIRLRNYLRDLIVDKLPSSVNARRLLK